MSDRIGQPICGPAHQLFAPGSVAPSPMKAIIGGKSRQAFKEDQHG
jgi:hypothetical protein